MESAVRKLDRDLGDFLFHDRDYLLDEALLQQSVHALGNDILGLEPLVQEASPFSRAFLGLLDLRGRILDRLPSGWGGGDACCQRPLHVSRGQHASGLPPPFFLENRVYQKENESNISREAFTYQLAIL